MSYLSKALAIASVSIVGIGIVGCGGGSGSTDVPGSTTPDVPNYAKQVDANQTTAKKALKALGYAGRGSIYSAKSIKDVENKPFSNSTLNNFKKLMITKKTFDNLDDSGEDSIDKDVNCSISGKYHIIGEKHETDNEKNTTYEITFKNCVDDNLLTDDFIVALKKSNYQYIHNGYLKYIENIKDDEDSNIRSLKLAIERKNLTVVEKEDNVTISKFTDNLKFENYSLNSDDKHSDQFKINGNYKYENKDDGEQYSYELEAKNYESSYNWDRNKLIEKNYLNGYVSEKDTDNNKTETYYIYAKDLKGEFKRLTDDTLSETYSGVIGNKCLGGSVELATPTTWETNTTLEDVNGTHNTPYKGVLKVKGANNSVATIQFAIDDNNKTYGTITANGKTSEKMSRRVMIEEAKKQCEHDDKVAK